MSSRRQFLGSAAASAGLPLLRPSNERPNILWIIAEDFSPDLGCYGNRLVHSPNLDALAARGVRFNLAFTTAPVCSASRSAIAAGMYQTSIGAHHHRSHREDRYVLPNPVRPFTHLLRETGYHTSNLRNRHGLAGTGKTDLNYAAPDLFDADDWSERKPGQPFYAQINFNETHRAFHRFEERPTDPVQITLPPCYPDHPAMRVDWAAYLDMAQWLDAKVGKVLRRLKEERLDGDTIIFFFSDHGRPMPRSKQFLYDEGIRIPLIVWIPEKFKVRGYESGTVNSELISAIDITATTLFLAGVPVPSYMQARPFFGDRVEPRTQIFAARDRCDETVDRIRCVRDRQFKYIRNFYPERAYTQQNVYKDGEYPPLRLMRELYAAGELHGAAEAFMRERRPKEELYDLDSDPFETVNLAERSEYSPVLQRMRRSLDDWIRQTRDAGEIPEPDLPSTEKLRSEVQGWLTQAGTLTQTPAGLVAEFHPGQPARLARTIVQPAGEYVFEFRARSKAVRPSAIGLRMIEDMRLTSARQIPLRFQPDGEWHTVSTPFQIDGWLGAVFFRFEGHGSIEWESMRLKSGRQVVEEWRFRTA